MSLPVGSQSCEGPCVLLPVLPWPEVSVVLVNFEFLSDVTMIVQVLVPCSLENFPPSASHCSWLGEAANAGTATAIIKRAATNNKLMRLITPYPFLTPPAAFAAGRMSGCGGLGVLSRC